MPIEEGRQRVIIKGVKPEIDAGRFPIKRTVGEKVIVEADSFTDSHDAISCVLQYRRKNEAKLRCMEILRCAQNDMAYQLYR